jgi:hypothetical protein
MNPIRVIVCRVGQSPKLEEIEPTLEAAKRIVGGWIEDVHLDAGLILRCNEEGKLLGLPPNLGVTRVPRALSRRDIVDWDALDDIICGDCYFLRAGGEDGDEDGSVTDADLRAFGITP